jgi:hypothetical protein
LLSDVENPNPDVVLAEPFSGTVSQGIILVSVIVNRLLYVVALGNPLKSPR